MTLPPWSGDDEAMYYWWEAMIDEQIEEEVLATNAAAAAWSQEKTNEFLAIKLAHIGYLEPLRALYPHLADLLHPPPLRRGQYQREQSPLKNAMLDLVKRVKALWRKHYRRSKRGRDDGITAIEIAARYLDVDPERVALWVRKK